MSAHFGGLAASRMQIGQLIVESGGGYRDSPAVTVMPPMELRDPLYPLRGRESLVDALTRLCLTGDGRLHVLHGIGGSGKTSVVLEVVHHVRDHVLVWWVDARHGLGLQAGLRAVARDAGAPPARVLSEDAADVLWRHLAAMRNRWVLVVDNVDNPALLDGPGRLASGTGWIRPHVSALGLVLITAREGARRAWGASAVLHPLETLSAGAAQRILQDRAGPNGGTARAAEELADRLGRLPLALRMAGSYLAEVNGMPGAFREPHTPLDYAAYRRALDERLGQVDAAQAVADSWSLAMELLSSRGLGQAENLLNLLASFADAPIPFTLVLRPTAVSTTVDGFAGLDGTLLWRMLQELAALGLIDLLGSAEADDPALLPSVKLHPLIRDTCHGRSAPAHAISLLEQALQLEEVGAPEDPTFWPVWQALAPHAMDLVRRTAGLADAVRLSAAQSAEHAARYLQAAGLFTAACREYETVLATRREVLGNDAPETLSARHYLANVLADLGDLTQALSAYTGILEDSQRIRGAAHPSTLTVQHEIARVLHGLGRYDESRHHLVAVLSARREQNGDRHVFTLAARHELARVLHFMGRLEEAQREYEAVLDIRMTTVGAYHPRTLTARHNLACLLKDLGQLDVAQAELERTLTARAQVLGEEHPRTLSTRFKLACVIHQRGSVNRGRELLRSVMDSSDRVLGPDHPDTVRSQDLLGSWEIGQPPHGEG
ncbi:tetratricopeptide repeat protein [Streptomyces sp. NPDC059445]|uniref:tetratricopeptide repeat protein n=1 Tax=Streptomyces sp. NPDC059445 TaxID=3346832 RepID=UPI0036A86BB0